MLISTGMLYIRFIAKSDMRFDFKSLLGFPYREHPWSSYHVAEMLVHAGLAKPATRCLRGRITELHVSHELTPELVADVCLDIKAKAKIAKWKKKGLV